ncbi:hypothetical protein GCM10022197_30310 [Microlunatus spumicola]|uniref:Uncharacterized protein n=1 Tax=Microlunatus spumicola TaxID=81499 RepID=A0ABP6XTA7_9ACTN
MVLPGWTPYRRHEDDELLGYLVQEPGGTVPLTLFGARLAEAGTLEQAEAVLRARGLSCLADPWLFRQDDGEEVRVALVAAYPDRVVVVPAPWGYADPGAQPVVVAAENGADRLRPLR